MPELRQEYVDILEKREWSVSGYTDEGKVELEWWSPAGEDFLVCVNVENFPDEILDYSDDFDPDEHIEMWVEARANGRQDVPGARRLAKDAEDNYKQYLEWEKEDKDLALDRLRRCVQDALKEDLRVTDTDDRKGMLSTPGRGPSVYETAAVYSEIFRRARAGRAVAPLAVYSAAKYDETMTAARKRASVMLGL